MSYLKGRLFGFGKEKKKKEKTIPTTIFQHNSTPIK